MVRDSSHHQTTVRRALLTLAMGLALGCASSSGLGPNDLVVVGDAQALAGELSVRIRAIDEAVGGADKGVDTRIRACRTSLDVVTGTIDRAATLSAKDLLSLLEPFSKNYATLVQELDAEGLRRPNGDVVGDGASTRVLPPDAMNELIRTRVKQAVR